MLGKYGRLGNQMFQVAAIANLAKLKNTKFILPNDDSTTIRKYFKIPCIDIDDKNLYLIKSRWQETKFSYHEEFFNISDNLDLLGYFQSWRYILDEKYTRDIFQFSEETKEESIKIVKNKNAVSMHIRRTDYLKFSDTHPTQTIEYYENALKIIRNIDKKAEPIIFTDDKEWCELNFRNYQIVSGKEHIDMCAMSLCKHHIVANSSFSWWASWLGKSNDQIVIAPKNWFGPKGPKDTQDLLEPHIKVI